MTRWRAAFLRARLIPLVISLAVVLVAEALQMGALLGWVVASVGIAVLRWAPSPSTKTAARCA